MDNKEGVELFVFFLLSLKSLASGTGRLVVPQIAIKDAIKNAIKNIPQHEVIA
jgi:hypothetical protein